jgi:hypothetical protein
MPTSNEKKKLHQRKYRQKNIIACRARSLEWHRRGKISKKDYKPPELTKGKFLISFQ